MWVPPFGDLRITGYLLLPAAFRSLSRPSSAPDAKAFPLRSSSLDLSVDVFSRQLWFSSRELCKLLTEVSKIVFTLLLVPQFIFLFVAHLSVRNPSFCCLACLSFVQFLMCNRALHQELIETLY